MKTPDPQCPGPSVSLVEREETPRNIEGDSDDPEPAAGQDVQMKRPPPPPPPRLVVQSKYRNGNKKLPARTEVSIRAV